MAGKFENSQKVPVRKATNSKPKKKKTNIRRFLRRARKDWRYQIVFSIFLLLTGILVGCSLQKSWDKSNYSKVWEQERSQLVETYEAELATQRENYELELDNLRDQYENPTQEELMAEEAKYIAKVLYGVCPNHNSGSQRAVVWCVLNRRDAKTFPNTVKEVCEQTSQWISYSDENPVLDKLYNIALEELEKYYAGNRACDESFVYMDWSSKIIYLKNEFNTTKTTKYWTYD